MDGNSCINPFPVFYGSSLRGRPFEYDNGPSQVTSKKLRAGVLYKVETTSRTADYGSGWFRITDDLKVESWPTNPTASDHTD